MKYSSQDYRLIDKVAIDLRIDYGFLQEKIDVFALAKKLQIHIIPYSYLNEVQQSAIKKAEEFLNDGFTVMRLIEGKWEYYIFYNDTVGRYRQRFTIAHEIKHVIFCEKEPNQKEEELADHFARQLLAPSFLVMKYMHLTPHDVSEAFDISPDAANNALKATQSRIDYRGLQLDDYEIEYLGLIK